MKKRLRSFASLVLAFICLIASIAPISTQAAVIDKTIDFSNATDDELFQGAYLDWEIANGAYGVGGAWASTYLKEAFDLSKDFEIKLDFKLPVEDDAAHHFKIGLVNVNTSNHTISGGATAHFYKHQQWGDISTLNSTFDSAGASWYADIATNYYDGNVHTMTITVTDGKVVFKVDETPFANQSFTSADLGADPVYLAFQSANANCIVDNITIDLEDVKEYPTLNLGFSDEADGEKFSTTWQGWKIENQEFVPNGEWANAYLDGVIPLNQDKEISFTFTLPVDTSTGHEFRFGLVDMSTGAASGGVTAHFRNNGSLEIVTLNSDFNGAGNGTWYADHIGNYYDGQPHTMTIVIQDKVATYKIDGNDMVTTQEFAGANVGKDAVSIMFTSSLAGAVIDDIVVKDYVPPVPQYESLNLTFENGEDGEKFKELYLGWKEENGVLVPNGEWASTVLNGEIPLTKDKEISFDFCLPADTSAGHEFKVGLVDMTTGTPKAGLVTNFYHNSSFDLELVNLNASIDSPTGQPWYADEVANYYDGNTHTMTIIVQDKVATYKIDGNAIYGTAFTGANVGLDRVRVFFQSSLTGASVDNLVIKDYAPTSPDPGPRPDPDPGPGTNPDPGPQTPTYQELDLDFAEAEDGDNFATTWQGWSATDGVYKPNAEWANAYTAFKIPLDEDKEISFDFCMKNGGDKAHQFNFGFVDVQGTQFITDLAAHFYYSSQWEMELFTLNRDMSNPIGEDWIADCTENFNDGKVHRMLIAVKDGKASFYIDGELVFKQISLKTTENYFIMQYTDTQSYIDNFKLSDTLSVNPDKSEVQSPTQSGTTTVPTTKPYAYKELNLKFDSAKDEEAFASKYEGWSVSKGVYKANAAWANTYVNCEIPLNKDKEISFDFCMKNDGDKNHQFNIGFVWMNGAEVKTGLAGHFYQHAQYGELFSLNRDFGNPIGEGWIADNTDNYNDGEVHAMMIRVQDGNATFYIDGKLVFENVPVNMKSAYFIMQYTDTESYIDNFRVSDELTFIPDYPVSSPDPTGDETVKNSAKETTLVATKGEVVRESIEQKGGVSPILLAVMIGGSVIVVGAVAGGIIFAAKKKRLGK